MLNQYTEVADANYTYDDAGNMTNDGQYEYVAACPEPAERDAENRLVQVHNIGPLAAACDTDLVLTTGGDAEWFNQMDEYFYNGDAAQSGAIGASEETWMEATVIGPGYLTFRYKLESGSDTSFSLRLDGGFFWSGGSTGGWYESGPHSIPSGSHTLRWRYSKGSGGSSAGTAWVDYVQWTGDVPEPNDWQTATYVYDPAGRRIAKAFDGDVAVRYLYDGVHCIAEYDSNDVLLRKFVYGPGVDQPICMTEVQDANAVYYYHFDGLGSVVALSDADGDTVQVYEYSVYGQAAASDPNHPNPFLFTGRRFDPEAGLYYYRARMYNPYIGRFLQTDPVGQAMNAYGYCANNATNCVDPSGLIYYEILDMPTNQDDPGHNKVTVAEFNDDGTATGRLRRFSSLEKAVEHMKVRYDAWVDLTECTGWALTGATDPDDLTDDQMSIFWSVQTLLLLDHDFETVVDVIKDQGTTVRIVSTGDSRYDPDARQISWRQDMGDWWEWYPDRRDLGWYKFPPLVMLAHEIAHACGDASVGAELSDQWEKAFAREEVAITVENIFRHSFYKKIPTYDWVLPRPAYGYSDWEESPWYLQHELSGKHPDVPWDKFNWTIKP